MSTNMTYTFVEILNLLDLRRYCSQREAKTEARVKTQYFFLLSASINTPPYSSWKTPWREEAVSERKRKELRQRSRSSLLPASHTVSSS